jgi:hypothetical protein
VQKVGINTSVINEYGSFLEHYFGKFPFGTLGKSGRMALKGRLGQFAFIGRL